MCSMKCILSDTVCVYMCVFSYSFIHSLIYLRRIPFSLLLSRLVTILSLDFRTGRRINLDSLLGNSVFGAEVKNQFPHALKNIYLSK